MACLFNGFVSIRILKRHTLSGVVLDLDQVHREAGYVRLRAIRAVISHVGNLDEAPLR